MNFDIAYVSSDYTFVKRLRKRNVIALSKPRNGSVALRQYG